MTARAEACPTMIFALVQDFADALDAMPAGHPRRWTLTLLDEAVRRDAHFMARHPTTLFQCLWNTCWWYDCPDAAGHDELPEHAATESLPWDFPAAGRLSTLLGRWRAERERATPGLVWLRAARPPAVGLGTAQQAVFRGHENDVKSVAWSGDGRLIVSGGRMT